MNQNKSTIRILAIDSSTNHAVAALIQSEYLPSENDAELLSSLFDSQTDDQQLARRYQILSEFRSEPAAVGQFPSQSSKTLLPGIAKILKETQLDFEAIDLIAVAAGPGSFTGLRLGIVAAKTIAYATSTPVVAVNVAHALAYQVSPIFRKSGGQRLTVGLNIGRGEILTHDFSASPLPLTPLAAPAICTPEQWTEDAQQHNAIVCGSALKMLNKQQQNSLPHVVPGETRASIQTIGCLGLFQFHSAGSVDHWSLEPIYSRPSAAEEKRADWQNPTSSTPR